nr:hypothetical protein [Tanacetum cinerariifolium]
MKGVSVDLQGVECCGGFDYKVVTKGYLEALEPKGGVGGACKVLWWLLGDARERYRFRSLEYELERVVVTFGAIKRPVLALEAWAGQKDAQMEALWHAISDVQGENQDLRLQLVEERCARLELTEVIDGMRRGQEPRGEPIVSTGTPFSTTINQDAPSTSTSQTNHDIKVAHMDNNPYVDFLIPESTSEESSTQFLFLLFNSSANFWQWHLKSSGSGNNLHWQWELILPVGTLNLAVGMPCAFYSQQSSPELDAPSAFKFSKIK